ncbi:MAG TPA: hypothetical protein VIK32_06775, partial [Candidatus Limnocylindrales bacterium]
MTVAVEAESTVTDDTSAVTVLANGELACAFIWVAYCWPFSRRAILSAAGALPSKNLIQFAVMAATASEDAPEVVLEPTPALVVVLAAVV